MTDLEIIRLKDERRVWIGHGDSGAFLNESPFQCHLNRGGYLSIFHKERRGAVFPNEIFAVDGALYYFGQHPVPCQPIRTCRLNWLGQAPADTPRPLVYPQYGLASSSVTHVSFSLVLGHLRNSVQKVPEKASEKNTLSPRWVTLLALTLLSLPLAAHAPGPTVQEQMDHLRKVALHHELETMRLEADRQFIKIQPTTNEASVANPLQNSINSDQPAATSQDKEIRRPRKCSKAFRESHLLSEKSLYKLHSGCNKTSNRATP